MAPEPKPATTSVTERGPQSSLASLDELAQRIKEEHGNVARALHRGFIHACAAGELLIRAKAEAGHGNWMSWLRDQCGISGRTAALYKRLAECRGAIEDQIGNAVADLTLRGAIRLLSSPRDPLAQAGGEVRASTMAGAAADPTAIKGGRKSLKTKRRHRALNADGPVIPSPSPADPAPSRSAEPPALHRTDGEENYEVLKSQWVQYCEADFAALPAAMQTRFATEVLGMSVPAGDASRPVATPSLPFSVLLAEMMGAIPARAIGEMPPC